MIREDAEVVEFGNHCETLLAAPFFNSLYEEFKSDRFNMMMNTVPKDVATREGIYAEMTALGEFVSLMKLYVDRKNQIIEPNQSVALDDSDDDNESH